MTPEKDRIWKHATSFRQKKDDRWRYARFLFVDIEDLPASVVEKLSDTTCDILNMPYMRDKEKVFNVVYDRTADVLGEPLEVEEGETYLDFSKETEAHARVD